jgi:hypothetical protein
MNSATAGPHSSGVRGIPHCIILHSSIECWSTDAPLILVIGCRISMENPTTCGFCSQSSPFIVQK